MTDTQTQTDTGNPNDALWNKIREIVMPLVDLIAAKKEQFQLAANSPTLETMYRENALQQVAQLSEAELLFCKGLQLLRQSLDVKYLLPPELAEAKSQDGGEFFLARLNETLVN